jgi:putative membrane protein
MTTLSVIGILVDSDNGSMHGTGWGMGGMMIWMVLFWGAVILGIVWLIRSGFENRSHRADETALGVLDRRFAEGALSPDDYHQRRSILTGAGASLPEVTGTPDNEVGKR